MVEYFAKFLDRFAFTENGWVQSYGSRCVKPQAIYGDVSRPAPMTVKWTNYARSLTSYPLKGMLTGPITILQWSFVRNDIPRQQRAWQIALALRDEVRDLEAADIRVAIVGRAMESMLFGVKALDVSAFAAVGAILLLSALVACWIRANKGSKDGVNSLFERSGFGQSERFLLYGECANE